MIDHVTQSARIAGLFAGIGGFELAFESAGYTTALLSEIDPDAQAVLKDRFPQVEIIDDVKDITSLPAGVEIVTAGFPCQNLSMAGDKSGISGDKSGEVAKLFEILDRNRPPIVVIENVNFMLHLDGGQSMNWLLGEFELLGYKWAYRVLDTFGFGLPHRRRRVYLIASLTLDPRSVLFADDARPSPKQKPTLQHSLGFYWTEGLSGVGITVDGIPPLKNGSSWGIPSAPAVLFRDGEVLMPSISACERLQGFPSGWTDAAKRNSRDPRWRLLGNAVSVPVAAWVAGKIKNPGEVLRFEESPIAKGSRWPKAAYGINGGRIAVEAGSMPVHSLSESIEFYRDNSWRPWSARALAGFLGRANKGNLRFPEGFLDALQAELNLRRAAVEPVSS